MAGAAANSLPPFEPLPTPKTKTDHPTDQNHIEREGPKDAPSQAIHPPFSTAGGGGHQPILHTKQKAQDKMALIPLTHP
jgi:hypothetical protein